MVKRKNGKSKAAKGREPARERPKENNNSGKGDSEASSNSNDGNNSNANNDDGDDGDDNKGLSDNEPAPKRKRNKKASRSEWVDALIKAFVADKGSEVKKALHSVPPDIAALEALFTELNKQIQSANLAHHVQPKQDLLKGDMYRITYVTWAAKIEMPHVKGNTEAGWRTYDETLTLLHHFNRENNLPVDWIFPPESTQKVFGKRPNDVTEPSFDTEMDSAVDYESESESEDSESQKFYGIDALEKRMRKEYSSLSRGKVLYWWRLGTGTQIFVRYGPKKNPIYRVRAGSSEPYSELDTELVLDTRGSKKMIIKDDRGILKETWQFTRHEVADIIGVGWKIENDDEAGVNALEGIRPRQNATYPHTRVWGNDFVSESSDQVHLADETDKDDSDDENESSLSTTRPRRPPSGDYRSTRRQQHFESSESDADSDTSESSLDTRPRRSRRYYKTSRASRPRSGEDPQIRMLQDLLKQLTTKRDREGSENQSGRSRRSRRRND